MGNHSSDIITVKVFAVKTIDSLLTYQLEWSKNNYRKLNSFLMQRQTRKIQ